MNRTIDTTRHSRWTWSIAALLVIVLAILWLTGRGPATGACCGTSADANDSSAPIEPALAPSPPMQSAAKEPGTLSVRIDGDKRILEGKVFDQGVKTHLLQAASAVWGETHVVDKLVVDAQTSTSKCADKSDALFAALKTDPPIGVACDAKGGVTLTGSATSESDKTARERWARDFFGADTSIVNNIEIVAPQQPVTRPEDVHCAARMPAAVTFKTASSRIDAKGRTLLDAISLCLKNGNYEIAGYTDSIGSAEDNLKLSKARAESVRAYMILKGIDAERLVAVGYGVDHPIGDNTTSAGRASNRRIEFARK